MDNKSIIIVIVLLLSCCTDTKNTNVIQIDNSSVSKTVCPKDSVWVNEDISRVLCERYETYNFIDQIFVDDTLGAMRVNININYKYVHSDWDGKLLTTDFVFSLKRIEAYCGTLLPYRSKFYVSVNYNFKQPAPNFALYEVKLQLDEFKYYDYLLYPTFSTYILHNMTPSDFQAYDNALITMYKLNNDERYNLSFYDFVRQLSMDDELSANEEIVLENLIGWANSKPSTETTQHFIYFKTKVLEMKNKVESL